MQLIYLSRIFHGMARIVAAGGANDNICPGGQDINDLALPLVAPLGSYNNLY